MQRDPSADQPFSQLDGVLLGTRDRLDSSKAKKLLRIGAGNEIQSVLIASEGLAGRLLSEPLSAYRFKLVDWAGQASGQSLVLVEAEPLFAACALDYLPPSLCPVAGVLPDTLALICQINAEPLRQMLSGILENREVCSLYWTMPASLRHHHAHKGGLAQHSLEVATDLAGQKQLTQTERDLGIAGGLLHDIGKLWAYTPDMFPSKVGQAMGHELIGLTKMGPFLTALEARWPDGAYAMHVLLSGTARMRSDGSLPSALVARIRACDQRSCERDVGHPNRTGRSWTPDPWHPSRSKPNRLLGGSEGT